LSARTTLARTDDRIRVGVLGYGHWGPNLARSIQASEICELAAIADPSPQRLAEAALIHDGARLTEQWSEIVADQSIHAVAIATPVDSHFELGLAALAAGKHVLLEKPITQTSAEAIRLIEESERRRLILMVDHTYLFEPAVRTIARVLCNGELGRLTSWESERTNSGVVRSDANVIWDLAAHDLSILGYVLTSSPSTLAAIGTTSGSGKLEHAAHLTLQFRESLTARIHVNWLASRKVRRISIRGEAGVLFYDDLDPTQKVTVTSFADAEHARVIETETAEPLRGVIRHFAACISSGDRPINDGAAGLRVVRLLEAADRSIQLRGQPVMLDRSEAVA
jgi:predicted dehydrogenase